MRGAGAGNAGLLSESLVKAFDHKGRKGFAKSAKKTLARKLRKLMSSFAIRARCATLG